MTILLTFLSTDSFLIGIAENGNTVAGGALPHSLKLKIDSRGTLPGLAKEVRCP
jgi:hypothetical protein